MRTQVVLPGLNRRLVRELDRVRARELLLVVLLSVVMLLPVLAYVWQNVEWIQIGYRIERLKGQRDRLVESQHRLRLEKVSLESLSRIEHLSTTTLGLSQPPAGMVVLVDRDHPAPEADARPPRVAAAKPAGSDVHGESDGGWTSNAN
jgi:cell division protein FtsL